MRTVAAAVLAALTAACAAPRPATVVRVTGEGRAVAKPDVAALALGVEAVAPQLADAVRDADSRMRSVLAALDGAGIPRDDVRTLRYDVGMERRYDPKTGRTGEITGYRVVHELRVAVRGGEPARAGAALQAALGAGANVVHSIAFETEDASTDRARALEAAVAAARSKGEALARAAGRRLGEPTEIAEGGRGPAPVMRMPKAMAAEGGPAPIEPGELEFTAQVEVEYPLR